MPIKTWGYSDEGKKRIGETRLYQWEEQMFHLGKSKSREATCFKCGKKIRKGCYFYGDRRGYYRLCTDCYPSFIDVFIKSLRKHVITAKKALKEFKAKEGVIIKNNLISSI